MTILIVLSSKKQAFQENILYIYKKQCFMLVVTIT